MISCDAALQIGFYATALPESGVSNGIVTYTGIMRDALRSLGHAVTIVTPHHLERADGSVTELPASRSLQRRVRAAIEAFNRNDGLDPIHRLSVLDAFAAARREGIRVFEIEESFGWAGRFVGRGPAIVERLHGPHCFLRKWGETSNYRNRGDLREAAERLSFTKVQAVTAPTQALIDALVERYELELPLARAIPNPIPVAPAADQWRLANADPDQILCVSRFDLLKGADVALRAFALAMEQRPALKLVFAGPDNGLVEDGGTTVQFKEFVTREFSAHVRERILFLGTQPSAKLAELRRKSGFSLVTSRFENFPYSVAEAMSVGMTVLSSDTYGAREMIRHGVDGLIVPAGDVLRTAAAMVELASYPERLGKMGKSARGRVAEWLSPTRIAQEMATLYRKALTLV